MNICYASKNPSPKLVLTKYTFIRYFVFDYLFIINLNVNRSDMEQEAGYTPSSSSVGQRDRLTANH